MVAVPINEVDGVNSIWEVERLHSPESVTGIAHLVRGEERKVTSVLFHIINTHITLYTCTFTRRVWLKQMSSMPPPQAPSASIFFAYSGTLKEYVSASINTHSTKTTCNNTPT
jgi:hypothetical protein